ncbi:MAG: TlyA family RNA methyltransferase [Lachnospiraceae bacterium]|nr:TlyA family RNA methyltransferase [Lachnospiraceae bacterium]
MKKRLDILLTDKGLAASREKAKLSIMEGIVYVNGQKEDKAGSLFDEDSLIEIRGRTLKYVSRGGLKLEKALQVFPVDLTGRICIDIGASTGGFTDCMLQNGAAKVYSVDVGYGQLDYKLRNDERVVCMEKTNFRYMKPEDLGTGERPDFASCDVSFISLSRILPAAAAILKDKAEMVALVKPQFEAGRDKVGKKGVVRDPAVHLDVLKNTLAMSRENGFRIMGLDYSPIRGPEGNIEYLLYLMTPDMAGEAEEAAADDNYLRQLVESSHNAFSKDQSDR